MPCPTDKELVPVSKFSAIVCDHCDKRNVLESPPVYGVRTIAVKITSADPQYPANCLEAKLCIECYQALEQAIFFHMRQVPRTVSNG